MVTISYRARTGDLDNQYTSDKRGKLWRHSKVCAVVGRDRTPFRIQAVGCEKSRNCDSLVVFTKVLQFVALDSFLLLVGLEQAEHTVEPLPVLAQHKEYPAKRASSHDDDFRDA